MFPALKPAFFGQIRRLSRAGISQTSGRMSIERRLHSFKLSRISDGEQMKLTATTMGDVSGDELSPELRLLCYCARQHLDDETQERARSLLQQQAVDWDYLLRLALRQKVLPLLYRHLSASFADSAPQSFINRLRDHYYLHAAHNHLLAGELADTLRLFAAHDIQAVPFKGPTLAERLYQDVTLRSFGDLDILIRRADVSKASALLRREGYQSEHSLTPRQEQAFLKIEGEHLFTHPQRRGPVDLHWEFVPGYFSLKLDTEALWRRLKPITAGEFETLSLSSEDLLLLLSVHAAKEFWSCLVWLCDIAELTRIEPQLDWETLTRRAKAAGARRMLNVSLWLAHELLGAVVPANIIKSFEGNRALHKLALEVKQLLFQAEAQESGVARFLKPAQALERRTQRAMFYLRLASTPTPEDWAFIKLPDSLFHLYRLARPVRLAQKYARKRTPAPEEK